MSNFSRIMTVTLILILVGGLAFVAVNYNGRINSLSEKLDTHKAEISNLTDENTALKEKVDELKASNKEQTSRVEELHELTSSLNNELYNKVGVLEGKIASGDESLEVELKSIREKITSIIEKLELQRKEINSLTEENSALKEKVSELEASNKEQTTRIDDLQEKTIEVENSIEKLNKKISSTNQSLESSMSDLREKYMTEDKFESLKNVVTNQGDKISSLERKVNKFSSSEGAVQITPIKIGYVNATEAFTVFTDAVSEEREKAQQKNEELLALRERAIQGEISEEEYNSQNITLQAEKLKAQLEIDLAMVEEMIDAPGFTEVSDRLTQLKSQVDPIMSELDNVLENLESGSAIPEDEQTLSQINNQYQQLDDLLTRLIESKIFQITNIRAGEEGYDLVLRQEKVVLYRNGDNIDNLTDMTKQALRRDLGV